MKKEFIVIVHNIRSAYNVGSIFRTADGSGVDKVYISGYSPCPAKNKPIYLTQAQKMLSKTALGAEHYIEWEKSPKIGKLLDELRKNDFEIVALEQDSKSIEYNKYVPKKSIALLIGNEPKGLDKRILNKCDKIIEIPMIGKKKSLNVSVAFGIAAYELLNK